MLSSKYRSEMTDKMREIVKRQHGSRPDREIDHADADELLCQVLVAEGYDEMVKLYEKVEKYYS